MGDTLTDSGETGFEVCDIYVTSDMLSTYKTNISSIVDKLKVDVTNNIDITDVVNAANATLTDIDTKMALSRTRINECIDFFKKKRGQPENDDTQTSYTLLENTKMIHKEIILNRIQIIVYIFALIIIFYILE